MKRRAGDTLAPGVRCPRPTTLAVTVLVAVALGAGSGAQAGTPADKIFTGGDIITVDDANPTAEAVAVRDGRIVAVGDRDAVMDAWQGANTLVIELDGRTLVPGFIDAHGHLTNVGFQAVAANLLPPPDGEGSSVTELQRLLREWMAESKIDDRFGWVIGFGYDDAQLAEKRHPTRDELDAVSSELPILIIHQSGHLATASSKALEMAGITADSEDPPGGIIRRQKGSHEPNGVLEESAFWMIGGALPQISDADKLHLIQRGQDLYTRFGYTTAQEGRATNDNVAALAAAAEQGKLVIDVVAYPDIVMAERSMSSPYYSHVYRGRFRIGGVKLSLDGSPQGKTAWLTRPYKVPPPGQRGNYAGYAAFTDDIVFDKFDLAFSHGWQILAHVNGDAAIDQMIAAVAAAADKHGPADRRPVAIHAQTAREDQLDAMKELGVIPSFFSMHTYYWGDWHREETLGPERADRISPARSAERRGMIWTSHHDAPVALPSSIRVLSSQVTRRSRSGDIIGPEQRVSPMSALKALTIWAAYQYFEEDRKGSIETGKLADFVILSANPLEVDPETLADLRVLETIKEGETVYQARGADQESGLTALVGAWTLIELDGKPLARSARMEPTLEVATDGTFAGTTGVNRYRTQAELGPIASGQLELGPAVTTRRSGPPEAMELEQAFLERLAAVSTFARQGDILRLYNGDGEALSFERSSR